MPTPRDDEFQLPVLDSKWTWQPGSLGASTYDLASNPGNLVFNVDSLTQLNLLTGCPLVRQGNDYQYYAAEVDIANANFGNSSQMIGVLVSMDTSYTYFVILVKTQNAVTAYYKSGATIVQIATVAVATNINIALRIEYKNGKCKFFYKLLTGNYVQVGGEFTPV